MTKWNPLYTPTLLPTGFLDDANSVIDYITKAIEETSNFLETFGLTPDDLQKLNAAETAVRLAVTIIKSTISAIGDILTGSNVHALVIPIAKNTYNFPNIFDIPKENITVPPTITDLQREFNSFLGVPTTAANDAYQNTINGRGGNTGFFNFFAQSLANKNDPNRPQYGSSDAVAMTVIMAGAPSLAGLIPALNFFDQLTKPKTGASFSARLDPVIQDLRTRVVAVSLTGGKQGVEVRWDLRRNPHNPEYFPGMGITIDEIAIIRTTDYKAVKATTVLDLFNTLELKEGLTYNGSTVVAVVDGDTKYYVDDSVTLDPKTPIYYLAACRYTVSENDKAITKMAFNRLSNFSKVNNDRPTVAPSGGINGAFEWISFPKPLNVLPGLETTVDAVSEFVKKYIDAWSPTVTDAVDDVRNYYKEAAVRLVARGKEIVSVVERLKAMLNQPLPNIYVTTMHSASGGNSYLLSELAVRLGDRTDNSRPPFDAGEYVAGMCFVAGAARLADIQAAIDFFNMLFGGSEPSTSSLTKAITAIDTAVTLAESIVLGDDMQPVSGTAGAAGASGAGASGTGGTSGGFVIADDGTVVDGSSAKNPDAGVTNVVPTSELC